MDFLRKTPVRIQILIDNNVQEQVTYFNYLGCDDLYINDKHIEKKLNKFTYTCATIKLLVKVKIQGK